MLFSFVFPGSDHRLASSSPRNLCARRLPRHPRLLRLCRGTSWGPGPGAGTCPELLGALDSSFLGLTLNLQLSTFNRVSFLFPSSPHLCALCVLRGENSSSFRSSLIPRHSPLATNSFTIRTSKTPLPQPLYNPHLQAPLGSAGNKGLITPLESALTKNSPVTSLESALTKRWGWGYGASLSAFWAPVKSRGLPPPEMQLRDVLRLSPFLAARPKNRLLTPIIATLPNRFSQVLCLPHIQDPPGVLWLAAIRRGALFAPRWGAGSPRCRGYLSWASAAKRRED